MPPRNQQTSYDVETRQTRFTIIIDGSASTSGGRSVVFKRQAEERYGYYRLDAVRTLMIELGLSFIEQVYITGGRQGFWFFGVSLDKHRNLNFLRDMEGVRSERTVEQRSTTTTKWQEP